MPKIQSCLLVALLTFNLKETSSTESLSESASGELIPNEDHYFDVLLFTQRWPVTSCMLWLKANKQHTCNLPSPKEIWTIHGVWPTKFETIGPVFCNHSATFDVHELAPFQTQLLQFWINIEHEKGVSSLWKHEWLKHGTCAAQLSTLNSENKYFGQGLSWMQQYSMSSVLQKGGIKPDSNHSLLEIHTSITSVLNKIPAIYCYHEPISDKIYLDEIRLCFNKSLELIDCEHIVDDDDTMAYDYPGGQIITNCDLSRVIEYPSIVPSSVHMQATKPTWKFPFVNIYKLIQLVQWFTM